MTTLTKQELTATAPKTDELVELRRRLRQLCEKWQDLAEQQECADELEALLDESEGG